MVVMVIAAVAEKYVLQEVEKEKNNGINNFIPLHCAEGYFIGNCFKAVGHRSVCLYDAVCPDKCNPPDAFSFCRKLSVYFSHTKINKNYCIQLYFML